MISLRRVCLAWSPSRFSPALLGLGEFELAPIRADSPEGSGESDPLQGTPQVLVVKLEELVNGQIAR